MPNPLQDSPLAACHRAGGARMVPFAGWNLPLQFSGLLLEHHATRRAAGLFDISHMGQIFAQGTGSLACLERLLANDPAKLADGEGHYTFLLNDQGGVVDDLFLYRLGREGFLLVVNAARHRQVSDFLITRETSQIRFSGSAGTRVGMALQGPRSAGILAPLFPRGFTLPERNRIVSVTLENGEAWVGRTGYTGEDGFEIFTDVTTGPKIWNRLLSAGQAEGLVPCGLGARDSLRLEAGLPLNGQDLCPDISPIEAGLGVFVDISRTRDFPGRPIMEQQKRAGAPRVTLGLTTEPGQVPPRHGYPVFQAGQPIGQITSGLPSPTLGYGIALALVKAPAPALGQLLEFEVRGRRVPAKVSGRKFLKRP